ncbi:unnamed protein product, partial [Didymodactylos carnosus]
AEETIEDMDDLLTDVIQYDFVPSGDVVEHDGVAQGGTDDSANTSNNESASSDKSQQEDTDNNSLLVIKLNAVITRQQTQRLTPTPTQTTATATHTPLPSAPATTANPSSSLFDFSLDGIRSEQMEDTDII